MRLTLEDGSAFEGKSFGALPSKKPVFGEVVFNTGMVGYVESLTDPSYAGEILVFTYPLIGNYGVPGRRFFESERIWASGVVVSEYSEAYSHANARESLSEWLERSGVPGITGVDTRAVTKILREKGVMLGALLSNGRPRRFLDPNAENLVARVSAKGRKVYGKGKTVIVLLDCGAKENIARLLMRPETTVIRVPWNYDITREKYDGVVISNGPGDPTMCRETVENIKKAFKKEKPILGICLGTQLLALAAGGATYKLKYGHRAQNQPCMQVRGKNKRCFITSQNHGYAVSEKSLPKDWKVWFLNANDGSVEGIMHRSGLYRGVQFHPEASPGPQDTAWIVEEFIQSLKKRAGKR